MIAKSSILLQRLSLPLSLALLTWTVAQRPVAAQQVINSESMPAQGDLIQLSEAPSVEETKPLIAASNSATDLLPNQADLFPAVGESANPQVSTPTQVAQAEAPVLVAPPGTNYVGIGGTFGNNSLVTVLGKLTITRFGNAGVSFRPAAAIGGDGVNFRLPVTLEARLNSPEGDEVINNFIPFAGAGVAINTNQNDDDDDDDDDDNNRTNVNAMITVGTDYVIAPRITATAALNVLFIRDSSVEGVVGLGYNF